MKHAVDAILARAKEYAAAGKPDRAVDEIERARMLDPSHPEIEPIASEIEQAARELQARALELQEKRQREEEEKKRELVEQEIARVRQQKEEKRAKDDQARRVGQEQKIQQYLRLADQYLADGRLDEASDQLAFVVVIEPLNAGAADLQRKISEAQDRKRQEEMEISLAETGRIPVADPATHLELPMIHEAMILEYSGRHLALIEWAGMMNLTLFMALGAALFFPWGISVSGDAAGAALSLVILIFKLAASGIVLVLIETGLAKMRLFRLTEFLGSAFLMATLGMLSFFILE